MDVVGVDHTVETARKLLNAHRTALTYNREHTNLIAAQLTLRQAWFDPLVANDQEVDAAGHKIAHYLQQMTAYLAPTNEYEAEYLRVARQQIVDDAWLRATAGSRTPTESSLVDPRENDDSLLSDAFYTGTKTWQMMNGFPQPERVPGQTGLRARVFHHLVPGGQTVAGGPRRHPETRGAVQGRSDLRRPVLRPSAGTRSVGWSI